MCGYLGRSQPNQAEEKNIHIYATVNLNKFWRSRLLSPGISSTCMNYHFSYSELSNKHAVNLILFGNIFLHTCLIRTYTFIFFWRKFLPTRLLKATHLLILGEIPNYKISLSSFKLLVCCF